jgi:patatin-like phospholipase/acyl hydrolase
MAIRKILSIDGGGIRGVIPAMVLAEIEKRTGKSVAELFDMVAGTSTGGILALGFGIEADGGGPKFTAESLIDLYAQRGGEIFERSFWRGVASVGGLLDEKYDHAPLVGILREYFGAAALDELLIDTLISSYDIERRSPYFFKSWNDVAKDWPAWQVARATSAAPTFFEPTDPDEFTAGGAGHALVDGGVFVNNPALCAYAEARRKYPDADQLLVVSLGTGELTREIPFEDARDWGLAKWALPIMSVVFDGVSDAVDYQLEHILGGDFQRFQTRLDIASDDMDNASAANIEALKLQARKLIAESDAKLDALCDRLKE